MAKKYPSELNTRTVRIGIGDYALLTEISRRERVTMAEALHLALERQEQVTRVSGTQMPMPVFRVVPRPTIVVNGNKHSVFVIKPKGGVISD